VVYVYFISTDSDFWLGYLQNCEFSKTKHAKMSLVVVLCICFSIYLQLSFLLLSV